MSAITEPPLRAATKARVLVPFIIVTLVWSSTWLVIRHQLGVVPPSWSIAYRFAIAGTAMFAYAAAKGMPLRLPAATHRLAALIGVALFAGNFNFVYRAEGWMTSGLVALVFALLVVPNAIFARIFLRQMVSRRFVAGSCVAVAGLALLFWHELEASPSGPRGVAIGIGLTLGAVVVASIANVLQATDRARHVPSPSLLAWAMAYATIANCTFSWVTSGPPVFDWSAGYVAGVLYLGLIASALAFPLYAGLIQAIGPGRAAYSSVLVPVLAMTLSTIFEQYAWSVPAAIGVALVLIGLLIALNARARPRS